MIYMFQRGREYLEIYNRHKRPRTSITNYNMEKNKKDALNILKEWSFKGINDVLV